MQWLVLLLVSVVPGIVWVWFFNRQDSKDREPLGLLVRTFLFGMMAIIPAAIAEMAVEDVVLQARHPLLNFVSLVLFVGLVEEFAKFAAFYLAVYHKREFNEPMDGIIYGVTAALGFATVENMLYTASFGLAVAPVRAIVASLAHASFSGLMGYYVAMVRFRSKPWSVGFGGLAIASVLHGTYNFLIVDGTFPAWLAFPMLYGVYHFLTVKIRKARALSPSET